MKRIYLACPYSTDDVKVLLCRVMEADRKAAELMGQGNIVFSPISHSHPISLHMGNSLDHDFWLAQDRAFVEWADAVYVLCLPGWEESFGVGQEIRWAKEMGKEVVYVHI